MRQTPNNSDALSSFIARKQEIDTILCRLTALSDAHFNCAPDEVTWGDAGTLSSYLQRLHDVCDAAFGEGEYAV